MQIESCETREYDVFSFLPFPSVEINLFIFKDRVILIELTLELDPSQDHALVLAEYCLVPL